MRKSRRSFMAGLVAGLVLVGMLTTNFVVAQPSGQGSSAGLGSLVQTATSAFAYAQGVVNAASSHGLGVSSEVGLLAKGNLSLTAADAALDPGGNVSAGLEDAHDAMGNFTAAAADASEALDAASLTPSFDVQASSDTLAALNQSASSMSSVIDSTCANTAVGSALASQFAQDCAAAKSLILNATAELAAASSVVAAARAGTAGTSTAGFAEATSEASADLSSADTELTSLSTFTYASRGEAYVDGPLATQYAAANASAELQAKLVGWFGADSSSYKALLTAQDATASGIVASASRVSTAISSVTMTGVTESIAQQQSTLATVSSNLDSFSSAVGSLPLPLATISGLVTDATSTETSLDAYSSAMTTMSSSANAYQGTTVSGFSTYVTTFSSDDNDEATSAAAFTSSFAAFQAQLATVAGDFPLVMALGAWVTTFGQLGTSVNSGQTTVAASLLTADTSLLGLDADINSLAASIAGASEVEVSSTLTQNVTSVYSSESQLLNATGLEALSSASSALQSDAQLASAFVSSSQSLLQASIDGFASSSQSLGLQADALSAQGQSTSESMSGATLYLTSDLDARTQAIASAQSLVAQAMAAFESGQVAQGASLAVQASVDFTAASSAG